MFVLSFKEHTISTFVRPNLRVIPCLAIHPPGRYGATREWRKRRNKRAEVSVLWNEESRDILIPSSLTKSKVVGNTKDGDDAACAYFVDYH